VLRDKPAPACTVCMTTALLRGAAYREQTACCVSENAVQLCSGSECGFPPAVSGPVLTALLCDSLWLWWVFAGLGVSRCPEVDPARQTHGDPHRHLERRVRGALRGCASTCLFCLCADVSCHGPNKALGTLQSLPVALECAALCPLPVVFCAVQYADAPAPPIVPRADVLGLPRRGAQRGHRGSEAGSGAG
jgi:hypothetical protein